MCRQYIGYVQSSIFSLTPIQIKEYMKNVKYIIYDANDTKGIASAFQFILYWTKRGIRKYVLACGSGDLIQFSNLVQNTPFLKDVLFVATNSNANITRQLTQNIYFSLTVLSTILNNFKNIPPGRSMVVVSNSNNPFFEQIYNMGILPRYKLNELTIEEINSFVTKGGANILFAPESTQECEQFTQLILNPQCLFTRQLNIIEPQQTQIPILKTLLQKISSLITVSSGVSLSATTQTFPNINQFTLYDNTSISLVNQSKHWKTFINNGILSKGLSNYGTNIVPIQK